MVAVFPVVSFTSLPLHTHLSCACLTHNWAVVSGCFPGGRHTPEWNGQPHRTLLLVQHPSLCVGLETCLYFTGTKCHRCSHATKGCSTQSSVIGFSSASNGRGHACQLLSVAQILPTGCAKAVRGCVSLTATFSACKGKSSRSVSLRHLYYLHPKATFQLSGAVSWKGLAIKRFLPLYPRLPVCVSTHTLYTHTHTHTCARMCVCLKEQGPMQNHQEMPSLTLAELQPLVSKLGHI